MTLTFTLVTGAGIAVALAGAYRGWRAMGLRRRDFAADMISAGGLLGLIAYAPGVWA